MSNKMSSCHVNLSILFWGRCVWSAVVFINFLFLSVWISVFNMSYVSDLSQSSEYLSFRSSIPLRKVVVDSDGAKVNNSFHSSMNKAIKLHPTAYVLISILYLKATNVTIKHDPNLFFTDMADIRFWSKNSELSSDMFTTSFWDRWYILQTGDGTVLAGCPRYRRGGSGLLELEGMVWRIQKTYRLLGAWSSSYLWCLIRFVWPLI